MKKLIKFILKQFIKCLIFFFVSSFCFYCCTRKTAYADYQRVIEYNSADITVSGGIYYYTPYFTASSTGETYVSLSLSSGSNPSSRWESSDGGVTPSVSFSSVNQLSAGKQYRLRMTNAPNVTGVTITMNYSGNDPDIGTASYEQRYNTDYIYSGSFTRSLTERVIFTRWYPDDLYPNMNSIEVNGSTVGNDQLQFRISYFSNGVIIGSSAWFDSGFKMPISDQVEYDYLSIGLRLPDENDPTGLYDLQPSELDLCVVTVGYRTKVYMSLEPADEIPLTTQDYSIEVPTIDYNDLDTANINGFDDYITVIAQATSGLLSASGIMPFAIFLFVLSVIFFFLVG